MNDQFEIFFPSDISSQDGKPPNYKPLPNKIDFQKLSFPLPWDRERARIALELEQTVDDFLDDKERAFLKRTIETTERTGTGLSPSEFTYKGTWYWQGVDGTCAAWSTVNAMHVLEVKPDFDCVAEMINETLKEENRNRGLKMSEVVAIILKYPNIGIVINELLLEERLGLVTDYKPITELEIQFHTSKLGTKPDFAQLETEKKEFHRKRTEETIHKNAAIVKKTIDNGGILLTDVFPQRYINVKEKTSHAICIVGYRVNQIGHMNVQVIDPDRGKVWMSIEHFSSSFPSSTYLMRKTKS